MLWGQGLHFENRCVQLNIFSAQSINQPLSVGHQMAPTLFLHVVSNGLNPRLCHLLEADSVHTFLGSAQQVVNKCLTGWTMWPASQHAPVRGKWDDG